MDAINLEPGKPYGPGFLLSPRVYAERLNPYSTIKSGALAVHMFRAITRKSAHPGPSDNHAFTRETPVHPDSLELIMQGNVMWEAASPSAGLSGANYRLMEKLSLHGDMEMLFEGPEVYVTCLRHIAFQRAL